MFNTRCAQLAACLGMAATWAVSNPIHAQEKPSQQPAAGSQDPYQAAQTPLDKRIKTDKITDYDPPPLPERVVMPKPPEVHISTNANQVPISAESWKSAQESLKKGLEYLKSRQDASGAWM